ncbi:MAG: VIT1/CCC1 transporter family protein [Dehalococcoidia bacterium]
MRSPRGRRERLEASHTPAAIRARLRGGPDHSYLRDFVYGAIDGAVTTFAVVAGATGAHLAAGLVLVFGFANLLADGFSMAVSNYLGTRAEEQRRSRLRAEESLSLDAFPEGEREEVRQMFEAKGITGDTLERVVAVITGDRSLWVETMLREEYGLPVTGRSAARAGVSTFVAFMLAGAVPLVVFVVDLFWPGAIPAVIWWSGGMTAAVFFGTGAAKARVVDESWWRSGIETLALGGGAALLAYAVGWLLQGFAASA